MIKIKTITIILIKQYILYVDSKKAYLKYMYDNWQITFPYSFNLHYVHIWSYHHIDMSRGVSNKTRPDRYLWRNLYNSRWLHCHVCKLTDQIQLTIVSSSGRTPAVITPWNRNPIHVKRILDWNIIHVCRCELVLQPTLGRYECAKFMITCAANRAVTLWKDSQEWKLYHIYDK